MGYDRTIRAAMVEQLEKTDPEAYAELLHLRRYNPQGYRKQLKRLLRRGVVHPPGQAPVKKKAPTSKKSTKKAAPKKAAPKKAAPKKATSTKASATKKKAPAKKATTAKKTAAKKTSTKTSKAKK